MNAEPWFVDLANYLVTGELPKSHEISQAQRMKLKSEAKYYFWDDLYLWKMCSDTVIRRCILEWVQKDVLNHCVHIFKSSFSPKVLYVCYFIDRSRNI